MAIKPQNTIPVLKDKIVNYHLDLSSATTAKPVFCDLDADYELVNVDLVVTTTYIALAAASVSIGHGAYVDSSGATVNADNTQYVNAVSLGTSQIAAGTPVPLTPDLTYVPAGAPLTITQPAATSQTGEVLVVLKLRPKEKAHGNASKRPGASAQKLSTE